MALYGRITSHEGGTNIGIITPNNSAQGVMFLVGDLKNRKSDEQQLSGREVSFDIVQTDRGPMAINISLLGSRLLRPSDWLAALLAPILTTALAGYLWEFERWAPIVSYLAAVNLVAFLLLVCQSNRGYSPRLRPSEVVVALMAFGGAAVAIFFASSLVPNKWRTDAGRFALLIMVVLQIFVVRSIEPKLVSREASQYLFRSDR
jgi:uncharacterized membrane protein YsdA (DUF1294 family)/cold shock CspA family protein